MRCTRITTGWALGKKNHYFWVGVVIKNALKKMILKDIAHDFISEAEESNVLFISFCENE